MAWREHCPEVRVKMSLVEKFIKTTSAQGMLLDICSTFMFKRWPLTFGILDQEAVEIVFSKVVSCRVVCGFGCTGSVEWNG